MLTAISYSALIHFLVWVFIAFYPVSEKPSIAKTETVEFQILNGVQNVPFLPTNIPVENTESQIVATSLKTTSDENYVQQTSKPNTVTSYQVSFLQDLPTETRSVSHPRETPQVVPTTASKQTPMTGRILPVLEISNGIFKIETAKHPPTQQQVWFIIERPRGSKTQMLKNEESHGKFKPDLPGQYIVGLRTKDTNKEITHLARVTVNQKGQMESFQIENEPTAIDKSDSPERTAEIEGHTATEELNQTLLIGEENPKEELPPTALIANIAGRGHDRVCDGTWVPLDGTKSGGTKYSAEDLKYHWEVTSDKAEHGEIPKPRIEGADSPRARFFIKDAEGFEEPGFVRDTVTVTLTVTDPEGKTARSNPVMYSPYSRRHPFFIPLVSKTDENIWGYEELKNKNMTDLDILNQSFCTIKITDTLSQHTQYNQFQISGQKRNATDVIFFFDNLEPNKKFFTAYRCCHTSGCTTSNKSSLDSEGFSQGQEFTSCAMLE